MCKLSAITHFNTDLDPSLRNDLFYFLFFLNEVAQNSVPKNTAASFFCAMGLSWN